MIEIKTKKISELTFADYNPRQINKKQFSDLKDSIEKFGFVDPILINTKGERKNVIIGGHQRVRVAKELGIKSIPVVELSLSLEQEKQLNIRLNKNTGSWDWDILANQFDAKELTEWGFDAEELIASFGDDDDEEKKNPYTSKIESPVYDTTQAKKPLIEELYNDLKYRKLVKKIEDSNVSKRDKEMLKIAATRHIVFNYENMAEYYAHSENIVQELMEDLALVIIDFGKAIEEGYVQLSDKIERIKENDVTEAKNEKAQ